MANYSLSRLEAFEEDAGSSAAAASRTSACSYHAILGDVAT